MIRVVAYGCLLIGTMGLVYYYSLLLVGTKIGIVDWSTAVNPLLEKSQLKYGKYWIAGISVFFVCLVMFPSIQYGVMVGFFIGGIQHLSAKNRQSKQEQFFTCSAYKIYRYMAIQFSAGVTSAEVIKTLHLSVSDLHMKKALKAFSGAYYQTLNFELASKELTNYYANQEMTILLTLIDQGLKAGNPYEMVKRQERLMIRRYFNALSLSSQWVKIKGAILAVLLSLMIFILLALPMLYEMKNATRLIFT